MKVVNIYLSETAENFWYLKKYEAREIATTLNGIFHQHILTNKVLIFVSKTVIW